MVAAEEIGSMERLREVCEDREVLFLHIKNVFKPNVVLDLTNKIVIVSETATSGNILKLTQYLEDNFPLISRKSFLSEEYFSNCLA